MKKNLILILIFLSIISVGCNATLPVKGDALSTTADIQHQLDNPLLKPNSSDTPEIAKHKKAIIKTLTEAKKEIAKEQQDASKLEKEKDSLLKDAGVGKFMWALVGLVGSYFALTIVKKFIP